MNIEERNNKVISILRTKLDRASHQKSLDFEYIDDKLSIDQILTDLIYTNAKGFRGVVLTALIGMDIDPSYNPLNNFYDCNPRSIFENAIWEVLTDYHIPCGKSDPLNVAKNIQELNESWAEGRRPQSAALAAVNFLRLVINGFVA